MQALYLGNHLAMDFLNTRFTPDGEPVEILVDGRSFLKWAVGAGLFDEAAATRLQRRFGACL